MVGFFNAQVAEAVQPFWAALQAGEFISDAAVAAGTYRKQGTRWVAACGGVRPRRGRDLKGRCLSFAEREEIALARARRDDPCDRPAAGTGAVDDLARAASQRRPRRWLPRDDGARAGLRPREPPQAGQARVQPRAAPDRAGRSGSSLLARADRRAAAPPLPRRPGDVGVHGDDLPVALRPVAGRAQA